MKSFKGQWALILGGSSGLGLATAKKLAAEGMNICILHRDRKNNLPAFKISLEEMRAHNVEIKSFNVDVLMIENQENIIKNFSKKSIKVLVHSIAKGSLKPMAEAAAVLSKQDLQITLHAMALSWYEWTRLLITNDLFSEKARNIAFTSEGSTRVWPGYGAVSAAKATLESLMRTMAVEMAPLDITTNCIQAGTTNTPSLRMIPGSESLIEMALQRNPFQRLTTAEDVANSVYLLCRPEADWINGNILKTDGGESLC